MERIKDYFIFSRKERMGIAALGVMIFLLIVIPLLVPDKGPDIDPQFVRDFEARLAALQPGKPADSITVPHRETRPGLFAFDPNTLTPDGWKRLGLQESQIRTLTHWREKGGLFRKPEDLGRIYGLKEAQWRTLLPYVRIANARVEGNPYGGKPDSASLRTGPSTASRPAYHKEATAATAIDINRADTSDWISLHGIGSRLAARIILFRERLGGFYSVDQVAETYGLPDSVFRAIRSRLSIRPDARDSLHKLDINASGFETLRQHPYIRWQGARAIVAFREAHGPFASPEDLEKLHVMSEPEIQRILPYLKIN